ncbi:hypothetical protein ACRJ4W_33160 [Streptomyces sp. GLT-R25]
MTSSRSSRSSESSGSFWFWSSSQASMRSARSSGSSCGAGYSVTVSGWRTQGFGEVVVAADHRRLWRGGQGVGHVGGGPPVQLDRREVVLVVVEGTPQHLEQVGTGRAGQRGDVRGVQLDHRDHGDRAVLGYSRAAGDRGTVDDHALLRREEVGTLGARPGPGLGEDAPPQPYVVGGYTVVRGAVVIRAGGPRLIGRPQQGAADRTVRGGGRTGAGVQSDGGTGQGRQLREEGGGVEGAGWGGTRHGGEAMGWTTSRCG